MVGGGRKAETEHGEMKRVRRREKRERGGEKSEIEREKAETECEEGVRLLPEKMKGAAVSGGSVVAAGLV